MQQNGPAFTVVSVRERPALAETAIDYFNARWGGGARSRALYEDCILSSLESTSPLPEWYLLFCGGELAGGAGLITNDFISRMDLWPWICAVYVEPQFRGHAAGGLLFARAKRDAAAAGFPHVYVSTDHTGYYEHFGFRYLCEGVNPAGERSRIYEAPTV